jgi:Zn-dependent peptidase ImmA (M78 family)
MREGKMNYVAEPLSRIQLRNLALHIRTLFGLDQEIMFPIVNFLELVMPAIDSQIHIVIEAEKNFPSGKHADTDVINHIIRIREDVYLRAIDGYGRDRMTIAHEAAHYLLMVVCGIKLARSFNDAPVVTYKDPEWQAKAFAGELLCPYHLIEGMKPDQIAAECGVSLDAAGYAYKFL